MSANMWRRRVSANSNDRGINAGSRDDMEDLRAAISSTKVTFNDIIDHVYPFDKAEEALDYIWQGNHVGKLVINLDT